MTSDPKSRNSAAAATSIVGTDTAGVEFARAVPPSPLEDDSACCFSGPDTGFTS